jgi:hypothetical protein
MDDGMLIVLKSEFNQHLQPDPRAAGFQGMVIGFSTGIMEKIISGRTNLKSSSECGFRIFLKCPAEVYGEMKSSLG